MKIKLFLCALFASSLLLMSGCTKEGPLESLGKDVDNAAENAADAVEDAADEVEDALD